MYVHASHLQFHAHSPFHRITFILIWKMTVFTKYVVIFRLPLGWVILNQTSDSCGVLKCSLPEDFSGQQGTWYTLYNYCRYFSSFSHIMRNQIAGQNQETFINLHNKFNTSAKKSMLIAVHLHYVLQL